MFKVGKKIYLKIKHFLLKPLNDGCIKIVQRTGIKLSTIKSEETCQIKYYILSTDLILKIYKIQFILDKSCQIMSKYIHIYYYICFNSSVNVYRSQQVYKRIIVVTTKNKEICDCNAYTYNAYTFLINLKMKKMKKMTASSGYFSNPIRGSPKGTLLKLLYIAHYTYRHLRNRNINKTTLTEIHK